MARARLCTFWAVDTSDVRHMYMKIKAPTYKSVLCPMTLMTPLLFLLQNASFTLKRQRKKLYRCSEAGWKTQLCSELSSKDEKDQRRNFFFFCLPCSFQPSDVLYVILCVRVCAAVYTHAWLNHEGTQRNNIFCCWRSSLSLANRLLFYSEFLRSSLHPNHKHCQRGQKRKRAHWGMNQLALIYIDA